LSRQSKRVYITGNTAVDQILNSLSDRLDLMEALRPELESGYYKLIDGKIITTSNAPLEADDVIGTENQVIVTPSEDGETITLSTPQDIDTDADVEFDTLTLGDSTQTHIPFFGVGGLISDIATFLWDAGLHLKADALKIFFGAGDDASIEYDGTDLNLKTNEVAPSDLRLITGTAKTLELDTVVWDDLRTPANNSKKVPGKEAKDQVYKGGVILKFEDGADQAIAFNVQLPHAYKLGEDIEFHIHIILPIAGVGAGAENVKFDLTHSWADIGAAMPAETTVTVTRDVQSDVADIHYLMEIAAAIDGSGISGVSSMLICSLTRDVGVANNYNNDVYLVEVDFHYPIDTMGSRQGSTK